MENKRYYWCVGLILFLMQCFGLIYINRHFLYYIFVPIVLFFALKQNRRTFGYKGILFCYLACIMLSSLYSSLYNQQNFFKTFVASYDFWGLFSVFVLLDYQLSYTQTSKLLKCISILFCCCYILQWVIYPHVLFAGATDEVNINTDTFRMRMSGSISSFCLYFYGLNHFLLSKKIKNIVFMILGFLPILIMGFRSLTILSIVASFVLAAVVLKKIKYIFLSMACFLGIGILLINIPIVQDKLNEMIDRQDKNQSFNNEDYIRYAELDFFSNKVFVKRFERVVGGGMPVFDDKVSDSKYASLMKRAYDYDFYWEDLGIVGLSFIIGIPAVLLLIIIVMRCVILCKNKESQYIRFTLLVVLLGSLFTTKELFRTGNMVIIGVFLYLEYVSNRVFNLNSLNKKNQ